jgi:hypothetical protein
MKTRLIFIIALILSLSFNSMALSASFPPKSLAFQWGSTTTYTVLSIKPSGSVKMVPGPLKFYQITGITYDGLVHYPVTGTGYVVTSGFWFSLTGTSGDTFINLQGNIYSGGGSCEVRINNGNWGTPTYFTPNLVSPATLNPGFY